MFADNQKISPRQLQCLLTLDWIGKQCLLLPVLLLPLGGRERIGALLLGGVWTALYGGVLGSLSQKVQGRFTEYARQRLGTAAAKTMGVFFFLYLLLNEVYLVRAAARVCRVFLLPEQGEGMLCLLFAAAGLAAELGDVQKRGRMAQFLYPVIAVALVGMIAASAGGFHASYLREMGAGSVDVREIAAYSGGVLAAFAGMGVILYELPYISEKDRVPRVFFAGIFRVMAVLLALAVILPASFGEEALRQLAWPVPALMSNVCLPGDFLQRWDVVFLGMLLFSLFVASSTGIHYMNRIAREVCSGLRKHSAYLMAGLTAAVTLAFGSYERVMNVYQKWAFCCMVPLMTCFPLLLWVVELVRQRCEQKKGVPQAEKGEANEKA